MSVARNVWASLALVAQYYMTVARHVRGELDHWRRRAATIPDPQLRRFALDKLGGEHLNAQAAAVFATLVSSRHRRAAVRLIVAFQVMYDYLDAVSEEPARDPIGNGLSLHAALTAVVVAPARRGGDFYALGVQSDDGGYLDEMIATCRARLAELPATHVVRPALVRSVVRCGEGQTRTHAAAQVGSDQLRTWGASLAEEGPYAWWELTAGAASSLAIHALFAAAGRPGISPADVVAIEHAYFPSVCALSTLLDAFVDHGTDTLDGTDNYLDYYPTSSGAVRRLGEITRDADQSVSGLRLGDRHAAIVAGISAFYLSAAVAREPANRAAMLCIVRTLRPGTIRPLLALMRLKRCLEGG